MIIFLLGFLGLAFGSFINAAVWRLHQQSVAGRHKSTKKPPASTSRLRSTLPTGRQADYRLLFGRSMCPHCRHQLAVKDLVPLLSWLQLRGKCRYCGKPISKQYPLVEALTAGSFIWSYLFWEFGGAWSYFSFGFWLLLLTGLLILALYDLRWMILPDRILWPMFAIALISLISGAVINRSVGVISSHLLAATLAGLFFFALHWLGRGRWMGGGDVKLALLMGLILGTNRGMVAFFVGFNLAATYSLVLIAAKRLNRKDVIPFGPFLIAATIIGMLHGQQLFNLYIDLFLPR